MGKVLSAFENGWPGAISRSVDDIVVSLKNASEADIPFGAPVFLNADGSGVVPFETGGSQTFEKFVGFAVRAADKTPDVYPVQQDMQRRAGNQAGAWHAGDVIEVLVRGSIAVTTNTGFSKGGKVYIRKSDGKIVASAGSEGTTLLLENCRVRNACATQNTCSEILVTVRNVQ